MSRTLLFECSPRRPSDGVVVPARLCWKAPGPANFLGVQWEPVVKAPPAFESAIGFDGRDYGSAPAPQIGALVLALNDRTRGLASLVWKDAVVTMRSAPWPAAAHTNPADGAFTQLWTGRASDIAAGRGEATVTLIDAGQVLRAPLVTTKFGTSGDALLDSADAVRDRPAGTVVPMAWGRQLSIPGLLVDRLDNIWLFSGRAATSVQGFFDGGAAFTLGLARASLAALKANVPAPGAVDYCLSAGGRFIARPWDVPTYPFTAAATFGGTTAADIAASAVASRSLLAFTAGTIAALNSAQGADCSLYVDDETTIAEALDRLLLGIGAFWRLRSAGTIDLGRVGLAAPVLTVPGFRRFAPERLRVIAPTWRRALGYARNEKVHSDGEIAAILLAEDLVYADGTPIEALKPAEPAADVTGSAQATMTLPASPAFPADYLGVVPAAQFPRNLQARRYRGSTDVTATTGWSIVATGCTASIGGATGLIAITAIDTSGKIVVTSLRDGVTLKDEFAVTKTVAPAPIGGTGGGGTASAGVAFTTSSAFYGSAAAVLTVVCGASASVSVSAPLDFSVASGTSQAARGKWQWRIVGGSYADISTEDNSSASASAGTGSEPEPVFGYLPANDVKTGLGPGSSYEFQLLLRRAAGSTAMSFTGSASAVAS